MSGGGSGGGGGSSGAIDYPQYMKERHSKLYDEMRTFRNESITNEKDKNGNITYYANPYVKLTAWSPKNMVSKMNSSIKTYNNAIKQFNPWNIWLSGINNIPSHVMATLDNAKLNDFISNQKASLRKDIENVILPKFRRGMQDINAVINSAYAIGEALIWCKEVEEEAKLEKEYKGKLAIAAWDYAMKSVDTQLDYTARKLQFMKDLTQYFLETWRMEYTAYKEYRDAMNMYLVEKRKWKLEMSKYLMDALGSIASSAGTSYTAGSATSNKVSSGLSGALSGAAMGAMGGSAIPGVGTAIGAVAGGAIGLIGGLFG